MTDNYPPYEEPLTISNSAEEVNIDAGSIVRMFKGWQKAFVGQFDGIPVRVDPELEGNSYYIAVSDELRAEIEAQVEKNA